MLCIPTTSLAPASSPSSADAWVAGSDKEKDKDKDKDDDGDGDWKDGDDNSGLGTDRVDDAWADRVPRLVPAMPPELGRRPAGGLLRGA